MKNIFSLLLFFLTFNLFSQETFLLSYPENTSKLYELKSTNQESLVILRNRDEICEVKINETQLFFKNKRKLVDENNQIIAQNKRNKITTNQSANFILKQYIDNKWVYTQGKETILELRYAKNEKLDAYEVELSFDSSNETALKTAAFALTDFENEVIRSSSFLSNATILGSSLGILAVLLLI